MICVVATIEVVPEAREEFLQLFKALVPNVLGEEGCVEYVPMIDLEMAIPSQGPPRENVVTVIEKWADLESLERHLMTPHMMEFRRRSKGLVATSTLQVFEPI